jgi:glycosyltransferase involved in cell wall biosynthesis
MPRFAALVVRILYHFRTRGTGAEAVHIAGIAKAFEALGHEVVFSSPTGADPRRTAGTSPFQSGRQERWPAKLARLCPGWCFELLEIGYNLSAWWRNRRLLSQDGFQLIYERHAFFLFATAALARGRGLPLVVEVNELVGDERVRGQPLFSGLARRCDRFTFARASLIVVVSPHLKRRIEALGIPAERVLVLPNAVDAAAYQQPADGAHVRQRHALSDALVIGFVGWFVEWHKLDMLVRVFARLVEKHSNLRLMLVGEGVLGESLRALATSLGVADKVVFTGAIGHADMPAHIAAMEVCVVPHSNEYRSPIKLFEYMGQGRLVVAPRTEPIAMVLRHGENGLLFEPGSEEGLFNALATAAESAELRQRLGAQARRDVLEKHTWSHNAGAVLRAVYPPRI